MHRPVNYVWMSVFALLSILVGLWLILLLLGLILLNNVAKRLPNAMQVDIGLSIAALSVFSCLVTFTIVFVNRHQRGPDGPNPEGLTVRNGVLAVIVAITLGGLIGGVAFAHYWRGYTDLDDLLFVSVGVFAASYLVSVITALVPYSIECVRGSTP